MNYASAYFSDLYDEFISLPVLNLPVQGIRNCTNNLAICAHKLS